MPIEERGYRRREPREADARRFRFVPIAREAFRQILSRRALLLLFALALVPFVISAAALYLLSRVPDMARALAPMPDLCARYVGLQTLFAILITISAGSGLIADDLRTGALLVYLSRPLTRVDYVAGKWGVLASINLAVVAGPTVLLWVIAIAIDPSDLVGRGLAFLPVPILLQALLVALVLSIIILGISAVVRSAPLAGALFVGLLVLFDVAALIASGGVRAALRLLSLRNDLSAVEHALFRLPAPEGETHWLAALAVLLLMGAAAGAALWRRVRAVEVVG